MDSCGVGNYLIFNHSMLDFQVFAGITCLSDVKCSGNWMWSGKTGDEGGKLVTACQAMCDIMSKLGIAVDGGKDSLSMSAGIKGSRGE